MALRALWPVVNQFQNKNGSILTAGKVYVYYKNRTALAEIFSDEEGTVVSPNPVLLDNNGRATVFASTIYSYTIVVCDYYGKELFSQDITLHYGSSAAKDVLVVGTDGSIKVDNTDLPNGVKYDLSVNTEKIATKEDLNNINSAITDLSNDITNVGVWEDISSEFTPTSVITYINRKIIKINRYIGLLYFNIDVNGNFYRDNNTVRQILFTKSSNISNLTFTAAYGVFKNSSNLKYEMPYQLDCRNVEMLDGIIGWLPDVGYKASYVLVSGIVPFSI